VVAGITNLANATLITNTTTSTIVFSDTYENQTPGSQLISANITPGPGTYSSAPTGIRATNAASPGPYQGMNYIAIDRQNGAVSGSNTRLNMALSTAIAVGDTMRVSLAYQLDSGYFQAQFLNGSTIIFGLFASPDDQSGKWQTFSTATGFDKVAGTLTVGNYDEWHLLEIQYTAGSTSVTVTRDGQSEIIADITNSSTANRTIPTLRYTGDGGSTTHFYVDAVPEPHSLILIGIGVLSIGLVARCRAKQQTHSRRKHLEEL
jgi:hypothetical protein